MSLDSLKIIVGLLIGLLSPVASYASDILGNPTAIGTPGQFELTIGGGRSAKLVLDSDASTASWKIGTASGTQSFGAGSGDLSEDQAFMSLSYALNPKSQIFANFGFGKDTAQKANSRGIGIMISPETDASDMKIGIILRGQQVTTDFSGPFAIPYPNFYSDGVNDYMLNVMSVNGTEQLKYTRYDAFIGASAKSGLIRPYGGFCLSKISGTYAVALNDTVSVSSSPTGTYSWTASTQAYSYNLNLNMTGAKMFSGVFGLSINPDGDLSMTAELQSGVQNSFMLAGYMKF